MNDERIKRFADLPAGIFPAAEAGTLFHRIDPRVYAGRTAALAREVGNPDVPPELPDDAYVTVVDGQVVWCLPAAPAGPR